MSLNIIEQLGIAISSFFQTNYINPPLKIEFIN